MDGLHRFADMSSRVFKFDPFFMFAVLSIDSLFGGNVQLSKEANYTKHAAHTVRRLMLGSVRQPLLGDDSQYLEAASCGMTAFEWHARSLDLASMAKQGLMLKKAPRLLLQAFQWKVCGLYAVDYQQRKLAKSFLAKFFQPVFLKGNVIAEETSFAASLFVPLVSNRCQLNAADIVGHLKESVGFGRCVFIDNCVFRKRLFKGGMYGVSYDFLAVVVIDFDAVILLEEPKIVLEEQFQVLSHSARKADGTRVFAFSESERFILNGAFLGENAKSCQKALSFADWAQGILVVSTQDRSEVERRIGKSRFGKRFVEMRDVATDVVVLVMKDKRQQVELRSGANIAGFIDEYRQLAHEKTSINKNAGGNPPALGQPSIAERWLSYTTGQSVFSRCNYSKHMFVSQCITAGRLLGKVA